MAHMHSTSRMMPGRRTAGDTPLQRPPILGLPGELLNKIFDILTSDVESIMIRNGTIGPHPFALVNRQSLEEFGKAFNHLPTSSNKRIEPKVINIQILDYDFKSAVDALQRCVVQLSETQFEIHVVITKQLYRCEWEKIWPWINFVDELSTKDQSEGAKVNSRYTVTLELTACNPFAAVQELYVEAMPYVLRGARGPGYAEIAKMRAALSGSIDRGLPQSVSRARGETWATMPW